MAVVAKALPPYLLSERTRGLNPEEWFEFESWPSSARTRTPEPEGGILNSVPALWFFLDGCEGGGCKPRAFRLERQPDRMHHRLPVFEEESNQSNRLARLNTMSGLDDDGTFSCGLHPQRARSLSCFSPKTPRGSRCGNYTALYHSGSDEKGWRLAFGGRFYAIPWFRAADVTSGPWFKAGTIKATLGMRDHHKLCILTEDWLTSEIGKCENLDQRDVRHVRQILKDKLRQNEKGSRGSHVTKRKHTTK